ncbi:MAG: efflux RND transporter periplasmic adaptor subunit, partial [Phycisphaeraceae bacterium]|nr:efflux RND transporter periplasmic adaptor subunit [Phycisphaeraceae bacterium]
MHWMTLLIGVSVLAFASMLGGCGRAGEAEIPPRPVRAIQIGSAVELTQRGLPGQAIPSEEVNLAFQVGGPLVELNVRAGQRVEAGDLLARIDPRDFQVQIRDLEGRLEAAGANLELAQMEEQRLTELEQRGAATPVELERARLKVKELSGQIRSMEAGLERARDQLGDTSLFAPFSGTVSMVFADLFSTIAPREPVLRLIDESRIKLVVDAPERLMANLDFVRDITCTFDALPGLVLPAEIHQISREASPATRTYPITLIMDQPDEGPRVLPGMAGTARGTLALPDDPEQMGVVVPVGAVFRHVDGQDSVWIIDAEQQRTQRHPVEVVGLTSRGVQVRGLSAGWWIATAGASFLREGMQVRLETDDASGAGAGGASGGG